MKVMKVMEVMDVRGWRGTVRACRVSMQITRSIAHRLAYITFITSITALTASAAEPFAAPRAADPVTVSPAGGLLQVTLSLLLVLAAVFAAAWAVRRLRGFGRLAPGAIEIVADVALGQKERAVLVQVGKQQILLGVAPGRVNTLHVLAEPVAVSGGARTAHTEQTDLTPPISSSHIPTHLQFKTILKRSLGL
jgi:flagellar protein FliO/FliZ